MTVSDLFDSVAVLAATHSAARFQVGANSLARSLVELDELSIARLQYRLNLVLRLLRDRYQSIQILVHEQSYKQLKIKPVRVVKSLKQYVPSQRQKYKLELGKIELKWSEMQNKHWRSVSALTDSL